MSNDNKTLADVQPGGRVRLEDQAELDRLEFQAWARWFVAPVERDEAGDYVSDFTRGLWCAWQAALSAQPSPGGQDALSAQAVWMLPDDARLVGVIADNIERGKLDHPGFYRNTQLAEALRRVLDVALAARQPVGEPVVWVSPGQLEEFRNGTSSFGSRIPARIEKGGLFDMPLYAAPPAQAVDLGQLKRFELFADEGPGLGGMSVDYEESDTGAWVRFDDLKALIDSQAVGNG